MLITQHTEEEEKELNAMETEETQDRNSERVDFLWEALPASDRIIIKSFRDANNQSKYAEGTQLITQRPSAK